MSDQTPEHVCETVPPTEREEPFLVDPGWVDMRLVTNLHGDDHRILFYEDGTARFEHRCWRWEDESVICAPVLFDHQITRDPLVITPSIDCPDCRLHGLIINGRWLDAA
jgi:hypothetical protein